MTRWSLIVLTMFVAGIAPVAVSAGPCEVAGVKLDITAAPEARAIIQKMTSDENEMVRNEALRYQKLLTTGK